MKPSYTSAFGIGAFVGAVLGLAAFLFAASTGGIPKMTVVGSLPSIEPAFSVPASAFWIVAIVVGAVLGLLLAIGTRAIAQVIDPDSSGAPWWAIAGLGAVVGGVIAFAVFPLGITLLGSVQDGLATVTVMELMALTLLAGISGGATITWQSYILARPPVPEEDPELLPA
jgi:hypothetical protein